MSKTSQFQSQQFCRLQYHILFLLLYLLAEEHNTKSACYEAAIRSQCTFCWICSILWIMRYADQEQMVSSYTLFFPIFYSIVFLCQIEKFPRNRKYVANPKHTWWIEAICIVSVRNIWGKFINSCVVCCTERIRSMPGKYDFAFYITVSRKKGKTPLK